MTPMAQPLQLGAIPSAAVFPLTARATAPVPAMPLRTVERPEQRWRESLALIERHVPFTRRTVHAGDAVQSAGDTFTSLLIVNAGVFKTVNLAADGREQVVGLHFKGDWIGFDGIAAGRCACDAIAMDTGEVWSVPYGALLKAAAAVPALLHAVHAAMSSQLAHDRDWQLALGTLPADARVADFVRWWAASLADRGLRTDQVTLRMTRAEIGNYLGMTLETVSRAFGRLARRGLIRFDEKGRREIAIPSVPALADYVQSIVSPAEPTPVQTLQ
jgi:CRP/FNR family transcriptional regulator